MKKSTHLFAEKQRAAHVIIDTFFNSLSSYQEKLLLLIHARPLDHQENFRFEQSPSPSHSQTSAALKWYDNSIDRESFFFQNSYIISIWNKKVYVNVRAAEAEASPPCVSVFVSNLM